MKSFEIAFLNDTSPNDKMLLISNVLLIDYRFLKQNLRKINKRLKQYEIIFFIVYIYYKYYFLLLIYELYIIIFFKNYLNKNIIIFENANFLYIIFKYIR